MYVRVWAGVTCEGGREEGREGRREGEREAYTEVISTGIDVHDIVCFQLVPPRWVVVTEDLAMEGPSIQ